MIVRMLFYFSIASCL